MRALVIGASGGIGSAVAAELVARGWDVLGRSRRDDGLDVTDEVSVEAMFARIEDPLDLVFVATGALHCSAPRPEKAVREITADEAIAQFQLNALGPLLVLKHALALMPKNRRSVFAALSARVGSIGDNRLGGWHSYRASKAALNQLIHGAAVELARTHPEAIAVVLHPGTVATPFTQKFAASHSRVPADAAARQLLDVIAHLQKADSGGFFDAKGSPVPW